MSLIDTLHAPFPPSQSSWLNYSDEQLLDAFVSKHRAELGTEMHEWASYQIILLSKVSNPREVNKGVKTHIYEKYIRDPEYRDLLLKHLSYIPSESFSSVKSFINDSIGFGMESEKKLYFSEYFNGTSDAIKYYDKTKLLRVSDLKTGLRPAKIEQVFIYAALYCLQFKLDPLKTNFETRIYQNDEIYIEQPLGEDIADIMQNITHKNKVLTKFEGGKKK